MTKKKVTIATTFTGADPAYSLNRVVQDQIKMLLTHGYEPTVIVAEGFKPVEAYAYPKVTIKEIPNVPVSNEVRMDNTFSQDVRRLEGVLATILAEVDICITHDIIYQAAALKHQIAAKRVAKTLPNLRWLHWVHSATPPDRLANLTQHFADEFAKEIQIEFPNSYIIYFNQWFIPAVARSFNVSENKVKWVPHATDFFRFKKYEKDTIRLIEMKNMLEADAICIYPIRLDRGKQVQYVIEVMAMLKTLGKSIRVIIVDFHSTGGDKLTYRDELKKLAIQWNLNNEEITFTSEFLPDWHLQVPWEVVSDLMDLANVFIMPSASESYSLITQESGLSRQAQVLNFNLAPLMSVFGNNPYYRKFGESAVDLMDNTVAGHTKTEYSNERMYMLEVAALLNSELENNRVLAQERFLRQKRSIKYIFKTHIEPLFYLEELKKEAIEKE